MANNILSSVGAAALLIAGSRWFNYFLMILIILFWFMLSIFYKEEGEKKRSNNKLIKIQKQPFDKLRAVFDCFSFLFKNDILNNITTLNKCIIFLRKSSIFLAIIVASVIIGGVFYFGIKDSNQIQHNQNLLQRLTFAITPKVITGVGSLQNGGLAANSTTCGASGNTIVTKVIDGDTVVVRAVIMFGF